MSNVYETVRMHTNSSVDPEARQPPWSHVYRDVETGPFL